MKRQNAFVFSSVLCIAFLLIFSPLTGKQLRIERIAVWKITKLYAEPPCYKKPEVGGPDFIYKLIAEIKAEPTAMPLNELVIEGKFVSNYESIAAPPLNLSKATETWMPGTTDYVLWNGEKIKVTKVSRSEYKIIKEDCHVSYKVDGTSPLIIVMVAHTVKGLKTVNSHSRTLYIKPCK